MADRPSSFNVAPGAGDPFDQLLAQVREAAEGVYDVLGEVGRSKSGNVVYLARELESGHLVAMKLSRAGAGGADEFNLEVVRTLDASLPGLESRCPECQELLPDWDRFCFKCGADLSGAGPAAGADASGQLLEAVRQATVGEYDVLGKMDRADGGGLVFFARDLKRGKLVALRLKPDSPDQTSYSIGETQVFRPMAAELGATQVMPGGYAPPPPPASPRGQSASSQIPAAAPAPRPAKPFPTKLAAAIGGVALVGIIAVVALSGGEEDPVIPPPPPADTVAPPPPPPAVDTSVVVAPPPPPTADTPDSASIRFGPGLPPSAQLTIDGRPARRNAARVLAGSHLLRATADGFDPVSERVTVRAGQTFVWTPRMTSAVVVNPPPPPPPPPSAPPTCARAYARSDWASAVTLCQTEANAGEVIGQRNLARLFDEGRGLTQDRTQAAYWYTKAAASGDRESAERLGYLYRDGIGVRRDDRQSTTFFKQAAEAGSIAGMLEYGVALDDGRGIGSNDREAATWYQRAAQAGNAVASRRLGRLYERGDGVAKNELEAANLYRAAGDKGDAEAQYLLGRLYKDGKGVERSAPLALDWFRRAAAQGHRQAAEEVSRLERP